MLAGVLDVSQGAFAGGGPENVLLVVNARRADSLEVANHYVRLRDIPAANVVYLDYAGNPEKVKGDTFRQEILLPALKAVDERGLSPQIDIVAYSCGFPWQIDLRGDFPEGKLPPRTHTPILSLTGATFYWQAVLAKQPVYLSPTANAYAVGVTGANQSRCRSLADLPTQGFRGRYRWNPGGVRAAAKQPGRRYLLSTMLGVTTGRGNTVEEVVASLERSKAADTSPPQGKFCFVKNGGIRSKTRDACYAAAAEQLNKLGARATVEQGDLPRRDTRVAGMMLGAASLDLAEANLTIEPGAICEHLTSSAGDLTSTASQTPLTELIRYGASGASGTVEEPYALQWKFPLPAMHVHYRRGSSLAEAFYLSVGSPFQLLIVGDPLCQPWADRPGLTIEGWPAAVASRDEPAIDFSTPAGDSRNASGLKKLGLLGSLTSLEPQVDAEPLAPPPPGGLRIRPRVAPASAASGPAYYELFIDGRLQRRLPSGQEATLTAEQLGPGWHGLCCVGVGPSPIEAQRRQVGQLESSDVVLTAAVTSDPEPFVQAQVTASDAEQLVVLHNSREVGRLDGSSGTVRVAADLLGRGPVRLQARAEPSGASSAPVWIAIE